MRSSAFMSAASVISSPPSDTMAVRALCAAAAPRFGDHFALRALLKAYSLLATALGLRLAELRESGMPDAQRFARMHELSWQLPAALSAARVLGERWAKIPERHRPHYCPEQRFEILRVKSVLVLSAKETAHLFALSPGTVHRWAAELLSAQQADPEVCSIGKKLQPTPPVRRYASLYAAIMHSISVTSAAPASSQRSPWPRAAIRRRYPHHTPRTMGGTASSTAARASTSKRMPRVLPDAAVRATRAKPP